MTLEQEMISHAQEARSASHTMRGLLNDQKNEALHRIASALRERTDEVLEANKQDLDALPKETSAAFRRRLVLTKESIDAIATGVEELAELNDPVGKVVSEKTLDNGLTLQNVRIPIGVICCIYESRPNVTVDIAALAIKSGNACVLRVGKEALETSKVLAQVMKDAVKDTSVPAEAIQFITRKEHEGVSILAGLSEYIDVIIPRGGERLIDNVTKHARMIVLKHRKGNTHVYVDKDADLEKALAIVVNAKTSNPSACNSLEHLLVHADVAEAFLPNVVAALREKNVEVLGDEHVQQIVSDVAKATEEDWDTEYLDFKISVRVVQSFEDAVAHIQKHATQLSDAIVTEKEETAKRFVTAIDSAAVYVNASTRFTDGSVYGLGAEVGISTERVHGMGPMGVESLTTTRYVGLGNGQIRT